MDQHMIRSHPNKAVDVSTGSGRRAGPERLPSKIPPLPHAVGVGSGTIGNVGTDVFGLLKFSASARLLHCGIRLVSGFSSRRHLTVM
jgi:hypothetical protein